MKKRRKFVQIILIVLLILVAVPSVRAQAASCKHKWSKWHTIYSSTYSEKGMKYRYCKVCGEYKQKAIPVKSTTENQKKVKKTVDTFFKAAQNYDTAKMKNCFSSSVKTKFFIDNKYMAKFMKRVNQHLHYDITQIKVSGKSATVKVYCDYYSADNAYTASFFDVVDYLIKYPNASDPAINKYQYTRTLKYYKEFDKDPVHKTLTIKLKKVNGKWKMSKWTTSLSNVIHADYQDSYNSFFD